MSESRTALITGASSGLGRELAILCAKAGQDVVLVARRADKLHELAAQLHNAYGVQAHVVAADLCAARGPEQIWQATERLGVSVHTLINNAGFGTNGAFVELDRERELQMVQLNVSALLDLSHRYAVGMRRRGAGRILNIASIAGFQPGPFMATYYATKAFVISFSEALAYELRGTGVSVTCHCPGPIATEFAGVAGNDKSLLFQRTSKVARAADVAAHAFAALERGQPLAIYGAENRLTVQSLRVAPRALVQKIAAKLNRPT